jgi:trehalose 6-phosphate phosphatase
MDKLPLISHSHATALRALLAKLPRGLVTDVDGTISPIARSPESATLSANVRRNLRSLVRKFHLVAVISGRSVEDVRRLVGVSGIVYIGNHGLERWTSQGVLHPPKAEQYLPVFQAVKTKLSDCLGDGIIVEDKRLSISIHYRQRQQPENARAEILCAIRRLTAANQLRLTEGRCVVELRPPIATDKGTALGSLIREYALRSVLYLGDDLTDVDAFLALRQMREQCECLSIAVNGPETALEVAQYADFTLPDVKATEQLLTWLAHELQDV